MKNWQRKLMEFMRGRNGVDELGQFTIAASVTMVVIDMFVDAGLLSVLAVVLLVIAYYRMFSKDLVARGVENRKFLRMKEKLFHTSRDRKNYRYFKCKKCGKTVRVPKGKGKVMVTCPNCRNEFIRRT